MAELLRVNVEEWKAEIPLVRDYFDTFGDHVPAAVLDQLNSLEERLNSVS
jgi:phosphoenolpyruvate carboxykinase (GTP)